MNATASPQRETLPFTNYQKFIVAMLAFMQFTIILDFMIMSPLGALLMPAFKITPIQFGYVVSAYAFSAGFSGLLAAGFADRFDRKKILLFFYIGFVLGTLYCALAPNYEHLVFARIVTGIFGGVIGSVVMAIITDLFPLKQRGQVMGIVQTAFSASQILGVPLGIYISNIWGWHAPFLLIVGVSSVVGIAIFAYLKPIDAHLKLPRQEKNPFQHLLGTLTKSKYLLAFCATTLLVVGGYMLMPFGSAYSVHNLKIPIEKLPVIYLSTGLVTIILGPLIGKLSDQFGKLKMFIIGSVIASVMSIVYTNLPPVNLVTLVVVNSILFVGVFSRMIPSQALISAIPDVADRGAFMSVSSSLQQFAGGLASALAGAIVMERSDGTLAHMEWIGYLLTVTALVAIFFMVKIHRLVHSSRNHGDEAAVSSASMDSH